MQQKDAVILFNQRIFQREEQFTFFRRYLLPQGNPRKKFRQRKHPHHNKGLGAAEFDACRLRQHKARVPLYGIRIVKALHADQALAAVLSLPYGQHATVPGGQLSADLPKVRGTAQAVALILLSEYVVCTAREFREQCIIRHIHALAVIARIVFQDALFAF